MMGLAALRERKWCSYDSPLTKQWARDVHRQAPGALGEFIARMKGERPIDAVAATTGLVHRICEGRMKKGGAPWVKMLREGLK